MPKEVEGEESFQKIFKLLTWFNQYLTVIDREAVSEELMAENMKAKRYMFALTSLIQTIYNRLSTPHPVIPPVQKGKRGARLTESDDVAIRELEHIWNLEVDEKGEG